MSTEEGTGGSGGADGGLRQGGGARLVGTPVRRFDHHAVGGVAPAVAPAPSTALSKPSSGSSENRGKAMPNEKAKDRPKAPAKGMEPKGEDKK